MHGTTMKITLQYIHVQHSGISKVKIIRAIRSGIERHGEGIQHASRRWAVERIIQETLGIRLDEKFYGGCIVLYKGI
jgi:hypothetical protein